MEQWVPQELGLRPSGGYCPVSVRCGMAAPAQPPAGAVSFARRAIGLGKPAPEAWGRVSEFEEMTVTVRVSLSRDR
jgi:hypothetical protein